MLPLNMVMPAVSNIAAALFFGATDVARRRTPLCSNCSAGSRVRKANQKNVLHLNFVERKQWNLVSLPDIELQLTSWPVSGDQARVSSIRELQKHPKPRRRRRRYIR